MSKQELRDELMTLLVAGHETTASTLAWAFERLVREPRVVDAAAARRSTPATATTYLTATIQETLRAPARAAERRAAAREEADRGRRLEVRARGRLPGRRTRTWCTTTRTSTTTRTRSGPSASWTRARHLHVDPVRRRPAPLPGRELRAARDEDRAARGARAPRACPSRARRPRADPPPRDHDRAASAARARCCVDRERSREAGAGGGRSPPARRRPQLLGPQRVEHVQPRRCAAPARSRRSRRPAPASTRKKTSWPTGSEKPSPRSSSACDTRKREEHADRRAQQPADHRGDHALVQHHAAHLPARAADRAQQPELARALVDRQEQRVGDAEHRDHEAHRRAARRAGRRAG